MAIETRTVARMAVCCLLIGLGLTMGAAQSVTLDSGAPNAACPTGMVRVTSDAASGSGSPDARLSDAEAASAGWGRVGVDESAAAGAGMAAAAVTTAVDVCMDVYEAGVATRDGAAWPFNKPVDSLNPADIVVRLARVCMGA